MSIYTLLISYSAIIVFASLIGGWLPSHVRLTHTRTQLMMSFVAGLMLGIAFYHLLPHAISTLPPETGVDGAVWWLMVGLLFMFVLLRAFHFHQHGPLDDGCHDHDDHSPDHSDHHHADQNNSDQPGASHVSWAGIALGLALHTLIDGVALAAAIQAGAMEDAPLGLMGFGVFVAIVLHKPLDAMSITSLMIAGGWSTSSQRWVNGIFSLMCPLGALLFLVGIEQFAADRGMILGIVLAFSAGVFICISLSDLLPEVQFHSHDRAKLTVALFVGIIAAYGIGLIEPEHVHEAHSAVEHIHAD